MKIHGRLEDEKIKKTEGQGSLERKYPAQVRPESISKMILLLTAIETAAAAVSIFLTPSIGHDRWLGGYSPLRFGVGMGMTCLFFFCLWFTLDVLRKGEKHWTLRAAVERLLDGEKQTVALAFLLLAEIFILIFLLLLFSIPSEEIIRPLYPGLALQMDRAHSIYNRFRLVFYWALVLGIQFLVWLFLARRETFFRWLKSPGVVQQILVLTVVAAFVVYHWSILLFRLKNFLVIPGWKWYFTVKEASPWHWLIVLLLISSLLVVYLVFKYPAQKTRNWLLILALGYSLQVGFGFMEGQGFESVRLKYADSIFNRYAVIASSEPDLREVLADYEKNYQRDGWLGTKPPGVLLVYVAVQKAAGLIFPASTAAERFRGITTLIVYVFPMMSLLVLFPLSRLAQRLTGRVRDGYLACLLYITCPSFILISLFLDQVLYPWVFVGILSLTLKLIQQPNKLLAFEIGSLLYLAFFLSFSLLPLFLLVILWAALDTFFHRREKKISRLIIHLGCMGLGFLAMYILFSGCFSFDLLTRYQNAMIKHREGMRFQIDWLFILNAVRLNNVEFASFTGFPITMLFLAQSIRRLGGWITRKQGSRANARPGDGLLFSAWLAFLGLMFLGQTRGEVQRLWLFLVPLVALYAGWELYDLFKERRSVIYWIILLQLVTAFLLYKFQNFYA